MRGLAEWIAEQLLRAARTSPLQWTLRGLVLLSGLGVLLLSWQWLHVFFGPALFAIGALVLVAAMLFPDSPAPAAFMVVVVGWWLMGGFAAPLWQAAVVAVVIAVLHQAAAWAALGPSHGVGRRRLARPMAQTALGYLMAVVVGLGLVLAVVAVPESAVPRGWVWLVITVVAVAVISSRLLPGRRE
ncbi:hypothetical protein [Aestuariimicrobium kwangyangense]|uniref:hypothetical protein n=1 Tax=Aestuariimicrobium kwangyangense TaxID=396389 RepID=UPI00040A0E38|nr:hypothetical protein [Aestuariimicrobium kwangyangense]